MTLVIRRSLISDYSHLLFSCFLQFCMIFTLPTILLYPSFYLTFVTKPLSKTPFCDLHKNLSLKRKSHSQWMIGSLLLQSSSVAGFINCIWSQGFSKLDRSKPKKQKEKCAIPWKRHQFDRSSLLNPRPNTIYKTVYQATVQ